MIVVIDVHYLILVYLIPRGSLLEDQLIKELSEIEKDISWHNFRIAHDKLEKLSERKNLPEEVWVRIKLLNSRNLEEFDPEMRLKFAEEALVQSKE